MQRTIEEKEKEVRPLQLQNLEMVQNLSQSEEHLSKLESRFMNLHTKHEQLLSDFEEQSNALTREKKAREDAQECEAQVRILLEDEADKKGTTREQLRKAQQQIDKLQGELDDEKQACGLARADYNGAMDELDLEKTAHGGSKAHLAHTSGSLQTMQTIEGALRAEIASARAQIDSLTGEKNELIYTTNQLHEKVSGIVAWLNRGQRIVSTPRSSHHDLIARIVSEKLLALPGDTRARPRRHVLISAWRPRFTKPAISLTWPTGTGVSQGRECGSVTKREREERWREGKPSPDLSTAGMFYRSAHKH